MATANPFDLLGDDAEDPSQLIAAEQLKAAAAPKKEQGKPGPRGGAAVAQPSKPAQMPSKPIPPTQAGWFRAFVYVIIFFLSFLIESLFFVHYIYLGHEIVAFADGV